jgi:hypothetical protein
MCCNIVSATKLWCVYIFGTYIFIKCINVVKIAYTKSALPSYIYIYDSYIWVDGMHKFIL